MQHPTVSLCICKFMHGVYGFVWISMVSLFYGLHIKLQILQSTAFTTSYSALHIDKNFVVLVPGDAKIIVQVSGSKDWLRSLVVSQIFRQILF